MPADPSVTRVGRVSYPRGQAGHGFAPPHARKAVPSKGLRSRTPAKPRRSRVRDSDPAVDPTPGPLPRSITRPRRHVDNLWITPVGLSGGGCVWEAISLTWRTARRMI